jgi:hypothetical protein
MGGIDMVRQIAPKTQLGLIKSNVNQGGETIAPEIVYPESDGKPMADNAEQERLLKEQANQRAEQERFLKEQANQLAEQERLLKEQERFLKEQEQLKYQTLLSQLKAKGIDITALE